MIESALIANPWYAAALVGAVYVVGYVVALYAARLYDSGAKALIVYREGYPGSREYADTWKRGRPASARFVAVLLVVVAAMPIVGQIAVQNLGRPELFLAIAGGLVLVEAAESLEHLRNIALFRQALGGVSVSGKLELGRRAVLTMHYVQWYSLALIFFGLALLAGSWFCVGGALGCVVAAQRLRDWVIMRT
jgi:hypothetical protein